MRRIHHVLFLTLFPSIPVLAATTTIEEIIKVNAGSVFPATSVPAVPGRPAPFVFRGDNPIPPPAINDSGAVVFRARSASGFDTNAGAAFGLYAKRPGFPLAVLVDTTEVSPGIPTFTVPGRPANNRFTTLRPPIMNNAGKVVFQALFTSPGTTPSSGTGIYVVDVTGGVITKIVDSFDPVPSFPTATFNNFDAGLLSVAFTTAMNDNGQIVYWGQFLVTGNPTQRNGIFGTTVAGGAGIRLADSTETSGPVSVPFPPSGNFREIRWVSAINSSGTVAFAGNIGPSPSFRNGVFSVQVTGGPITTVAFQGQPVPNRPGFTFLSTFEPGGHNVDINDEGVILFRNQYQLSSPFDGGVYSATPVGGGYVHTRVFDTGPGLTVPGEPPGAEFSGAQLPGITNAGVIAPFAFVSPGSPTPNQQGIFYTDADGSPISVVATLTTPPPGQPAPVGGFPRFSGLQQSNGGRGALNSLGNVAFIGVGNVSASVGFRGVYFYDACTPELVRISDSTISTTQLGAFVTNGYDIWQAETTTGMYRSINNSNDVAFAAQFTNFDYGLYIGHVDVGGGGQLNITCPPNVVAECPVDGSVAGNGTASAAGCGTIAVSSSDSTATGCGATETISRVWTADNGSTTVSCTQTITEVDTTGPVLSGVPDKATAECGAVPPAAVVTADDACDGSVPVVLSESSSEGPCPGSYILTRTWIATDQCGNTTVGSHQICVVDTLDPSLVGAPLDVSVECDNVPPPAVLTASDSCAVMPSISFSEVRTDGSCSSEYVLTRTWTATDECNNDVSATQLVTVDDTTPPTIGCPASTALECPADTSILANGAATGIDNCGIVSISSSDISGSGCGATQTITRTWTATDECSNSVSCEQFISVADTIAPVLSGVPSDTSVECNAVPAAAIVTASDGCDPDVPVVFAETRADGACPQAYTLSRTWTATDDCGNLAGGAQSVTVNDTQAPVISVDASPIIVTDANCSGSVCVQLASATAVDGCDADVGVQQNAPLCGPSDTPTPDPDDDDCGYRARRGGHHGQHGHHDDDPAGTCSGYCFPTGTTTVTYTAVDDCGNTATATKEVTVRHGANIEVRAYRYSVGHGSHPHANKQPLVGIETCAFDRSYGSCAQISCGGHSRPHYQCILDHCQPAACCTTGSNGRCTINLSPDQYLVIADDENNELPDALASTPQHLTCGETEIAYLFQVVRADGHKKPCKFTRLTGSELLVIEPEFIVWDSTEQLYPFVFDSVGDWGVTASVTPPEGFVADYNELSADVQTEVESVQFTITEVGSDLVPTETTFKVSHKGEQKLVRSNVGILLTPDYARSRGFDVEKLRTKGLIVEPVQRQMMKKNRASSR